VSVVTFVLFVAALLLPQLSIGSIDAEDYAGPDYIVASACVSGVIARRHETRVEVRSQIGSRGTASLKAPHRPSAQRPPTQRPPDESLGRSPPPRAVKLARG
jgi:hypothetical protein